jgi:hypothetical protein
MSLEKIATDPVRKEMDLLARDARQTTAVLLSCLPVGLASDASASRPAPPKP